MSSRPTVVDPTGPDGDLLSPACGAVSRWHRVRSDEVWHHYEGDPLELLLMTEGARLDRLTLGPYRNGQTPVHYVPAGCWQAARPLSAHILSPDVPVGSGIRIR